MMERIYDTLKQQIMQGDLPPGIRLDPSRLASKLHASVTPIRDALHRLTGERIVQAWPQEGFHAPLLSEPALRDLYAWHGEILAKILRTSISHQLIDTVGMDAAAIAMERRSGLETSRALFRDIASRSHNLEHRHVLQNTAERLACARLKEEPLIEDAAEEAQLLIRSWREGDIRRLRRLIEVYHRRRIRLVPAIAAALRRDAADLRSA
ncbi:DNA-binding GntR family transcriptional regulator [Sphingomonas zeicaulis]